MPRFRHLGWWNLILCVGVSAVASASEPSDPESALRRMLLANAEKDLPTLARMMAHDDDITSYSVAGRKYVGWPDVERGLREEFANTEKIEIPIKEIKVWTRGDLAWFTMEIDYIRYVLDGSELKRTVHPLRETGVLERRAGQWQLLSWHESFQSVYPVGPLASPTGSPTHDRDKSTSTMQIPDLAGEWDILEVEDDKRYKATLDKNGNGPYTQHGGRFTTTRIADGHWQGTWHQPGNDREGGFDLLLSEDGTQAKGVWWYTRVGSQKNIPPREHGGSYHWKRKTPPADAH
jgi:ketosteroid isomerase-like protein